MLLAYLLALREGLEAALIIGLLFGALQRLRRTDLGRTVWLGVGSAALLSLMVAGGLYLTGLSLDEEAGEVFEGVTMFLAAGVLTWMIFWMQRHARHLAAKLESDLRQAAHQAAAGPVFLVAFLAVAREGVELSLFLTAAAFTGGASATLSGALLGLGTAAALGAALFHGLIRLNLRRFFLYTALLLSLFAAGLVAQGVHVLVEAGWLPALVAPLWDLRAWIPDQGGIGGWLSALLGYHAAPALSEVLAYLGYFAALAGGLWAPFGEAKRK